MITGRLSQIGLLLICIGVMFSGCYLKSVHPLVKTKDSVLIPGLEGVWEDEDSKWYFIHDPSKFIGVPGLEAYIDESDTLGEDDEDIYFILFATVEEGKPDTSIFFGSTIEIEGQNYLDLQLVETGINTFASAHLFPVHTFSKISLNAEENKLEIELFKDDWIKEQIMNNRVRLKHEKVDENNILVTASTRELQKFVYKYGNTKEAFENPLELSRIY